MTIARRSMGLLLVLVCVQQFALPDARSAVEDVQRWLEQDPRARVYRGSSEELVQVFTRATDAGVPLWVLFEKLNQGAAKRTPPVRLVQGLEEETERLITAQALLSPRLPSDVDPELREEMTKRASLILAGGLDREVLGSLLQTADPSPEGVMAVMQACGALLAVSSASRLATEGLIDLGVSLLGSSLEPRSYGSVASAFARARLGGMDDSEAAKLITEVLSQQGGLVRINQEIDGRLRR